MGRRLLLIVGILLSALSAASVARGQDPDPAPPPPDPTPIVAPIAPSTFPEDLMKLPAAPAGADSDDPLAPMPAPLQEQKPQKAKPDKPPAKIRAATKDELRPSGPLLTKDPSRLRTDDSVVLTQAPPPSPAQPPPAPVPAAAPRGAGSGPDAPRRPLIVFRSVSSRSPSRSTCKRRRT